jgi:protein O-mannosyl-transferase
MNQPQSHPRHESRTGFVAALLVAACTFVVFLPALRNGFVNWDDPVYVGTQAGWPWSAFTRVHPSGNWHPLTTLSHGLDLLVWGRHPAGHHLTSILLHALNAGLVVLLGGALFGVRRRLPACKLYLALTLAALAWSIHPLRVESVAWVSERKDLLCGFFCLLGLLAYVRGAASATRPWYACRWYWITVASFVAALMSKPMAVSFPVVLLILDWFPLARVERAGLRKLLVEKLPLFALSIGGGLLALHAQGSGGAYRALAEVAWPTRVMVALQSFGGYLGTMLWPSPLLPYYSYPTAVSLWSLAVAGSSILLAVLLLWKRRQPAVAAAVAAYGMLLLPVLGLVQVGPQAMADRYTYLSTLPLVLLAAAVVTTRVRGPLLVIPVALGLGAMGVLTTAQIRIWHDSGTLWTHELAHEPDNMEAHNSRAAYYYERGRYREALADYDAALAAPPRVSASHAVKRRAACLNDRAITYVQLGELSQAVEDESKAIRLMPEQASYYLNRSKMYEQLHMLEPAQADRQRARALLEPGGHQSR